MVAQMVEHNHSQQGSTQPVLFAGDGVSLTGQVDYPRIPCDSRGYPLLFVIQHATCTTRQGYAHIARLGTEMGMAVFRWDKRGTGSSGAGAAGSVNQDTLYAYAAALNQASIDRNRVIIFAQNEGSILLAEDFRRFKAIQKPLGVVLAGNMLDEEQVLAIEAPVHIVVSKNDWNSWQIYAEAASRSHARHYGGHSSFYVAPNTNRRLMYDNGGTFHRGAEQSIRTWMEQICRISASV